AATSMLSYPSDTFVAIRSYGAALRNSSFTFSVSRHTNPSLSFTRCKTSSRGGRYGSAQDSTSQLSFRIFRAASNKLCVANTFGFDIRILARNFGKFTLTHRPPPGISQRFAPHALSWIQTPQFPILLRCYFQPPHSKENLCNPVCFKSGFG